MSVENNEVALQELALEVVRHGDLRSRDLAERIVSNPKQQAVIQQRAEEAAQAIIEQQMKERVKAILDSKKKEVSVLNDDLPVFDVRPSADMGIQLLAETAKEAPAPAPAKVGFTGKVAKAATNFCVSAVQFPSQVNAGSAAGFGSFVAKIKSNPKTFFGVVAVLCVVAGVVGHYLKLF